MADGKKSFLLYCDLIHTIDKMPDDKAGQLFKHILKYVNDENPTSTDLIINLTFEPIKQQLKRDLKKWEKISNRNSVNAKKRWDGKCQIMPNDATAYDRIPDDARNADSVTDNDNDTDNVKEINISFDIFWDLYDKKVGDKKKLETKWFRLKPDEREKIIKTLPEYKTATPDKKFRKNPETYLNNKSWNDEIIIPESLLRDQQVTTTSINFGK